MALVLKQMFSSLLRYKGAKTGIIGLVLLIMISILSPYIAPYSPYEQSVRLRLKPPSMQHWMGTDRLGRDILSRVLYGGLISLRVGAVSVGIGLLFGVTLGILAAFYGGWVETVLMRLVDALLAFPGILLALVVIAVLGVGLENVIIAVGVAWVPRFARLARGNALVIRADVYIEAARALGCKNFRIMTRHMLPNLIGPVGVFTTLQLGNAIITAAGLSFLGLGAQPPIPEWGLMCSQGRDLIGLAWWVSTFPGLAVLVAVLSFNLIGDGLRDAVDPRLR
jgi:peptide/nickel transport system permease protein